jgi:hypothetical protein
MARTKGVDLGLDKPDKMSSVLGSPPGEIDGCMDQGIGDAAVEADLDPGSGTQSGSHPAKTQSKIMRFFG